MTQSTVLEEDILSMVSTIWNLIRRPSVYTICTNVCVLIQEQNFHGSKTDFTTVVLETALSNTGKQCSV